MNASFKLTTLINWWPWCDKQSWKRRLFRFSSFFVQTFRYLCSVFVDSTFFCNVLPPYGLINRKELKSSLPINRTSLFFHLLRWKWYSSRLWFVCFCISMLSSLRCFHSISSLNFRHTFYLLVLVLVHDEGCEVGVSIDINSCFFYMPIHWYTNVFVNVFSFAEVQFMNLYNSQHLTCSVEQHWSILFQYLVNWLQRILWKPISFPHFIRVKQLLERVRNGSVYTTHWWLMYFKSSYRIGSWFQKICFPQLSSWFQYWAI